MAKGSYIGQVQIGNNTYPVGSILYGVCDTAAGTAAKVVSQAEGKAYALVDATFNNNNLTAGVTIHIKFENSNTASNPTLKVGAADAKSIKQYGTTAAGTTEKTSWKAGAVVSFTYDGTNWVMNTGIDSNNTYTAATTASPDIAQTGAVGSSTNYARQDHTHGISVAVGSNDGEITIAGQTIKPKNINNAAYKDVDTSISAGSTSTKLPTSAAVASLISTSISNSFAANDAMVFKGTIGAGGTINTTANPAQTLPTTHNAGETYKVITAGTYAGKVCEVGDMIICVADGTAVNDNDWVVVQTNIDGAVTGSTSSTDGDIALFDGTTGKVIKDSGIKFDGSTTNKWLTQKGTWSAPTAAQVGAAASDHTQAVDKGGTNITSYIAGDMLYASGISALSKLNIGTSGQILKSTGSAPAWSTFSAGTLPSMSGSNATASVSNGTLTLSSGDLSLSQGTLPSFS